MLDADRSLVLERAELVAQGTHHELIEHSDVHREIYTSQLGASEELGVGLREVSP